MTVAPHRGRITLGTPASLLTVCVSSSSNNVHDVYTAICCCRDGKRTTGAGARRAYRGSPRDADLDDRFVVHRGVDEHEPPRGSNSSAPRVGEQLVGTSASHTGRALQRAHRRGPECRV